jgi:hypothetical protein
MAEILYMISIQNGEKTMNGAVSFLKTVKQLLIDYMLILNIQLPQISIFVTLRRRL